MNTQISLFKEIYYIYGTGARVHGARAMTYSLIQCLLFITPPPHKQLLYYDEGGHSDNRVHIEIISNKTRTKIKVGRSRARA